MAINLILGQEAAIRRLFDEAENGKVPHARLICGPCGCGKLPLALAYARYMACTNHIANKPCGTCINCKQMHNLVHPDLHFVYPVVKRKGKDTVSDDMLPLWREAVIQSPYMDMAHWLQLMDAENQQAQIFVKESDILARKLAMKTSQGGWRIVIVWMPERMNTECANKMLKMLEEPPSKTIFLLISEEPDALLPTIVSRTQRLNLPPIDEGCIANELCTKYGIDSCEATAIARRSEGSWWKAIQTILLDKEKERHFELFEKLMRLAYQRKIREMKQWSEELASMGREGQKQFLQYAQRMIRESFIYNFGVPDIRRMDKTEQNFATRFAPYVNESNIINIADELAEAERHIVQNTNPKMVFFDLALKMIVLLIQK